MTDKGPFDAAIILLRGIYFAQADNSIIKDALQIQSTEVILRKLKEAADFLEAAGKVKWKPDSPETTIVSRFDEATDELRTVCKRFFGDWIWQERLTAVDIARALLEALPDKEKK